MPPAQLALALIVQAYMGISDDEVIEELVWISVGSWFSIAILPKATLQQRDFGEFRKALIKKGLTNDSLSAL
jgi:hypothetical protein